MIRAIESIICCCIMDIDVFLDTEDASEGETGKKDREFTGIKEQYVILIC